MARPGTSSGRPGSALRPPALGVPAVSLTSSTVLPQEAQLEAAAAAAAALQPSSGRQVITSARAGQLPVVAGARPASAGLKRPASAAGLYQIPKWKQSLRTLPLQQVCIKSLYGNRPHAPCLCSRSALSTAGNAQNNMFQNIKTLSVERASICCRSALRTASGNAQNSLINNDCTACNRRMTCHE